MIAVQVAGRKFNLLEEDNGAGGTCVTAYLPCGRTPDWDIVSLDTYGQCLDHVVDTLDSGMPCEPTGDVNPDAVWS